MSTARLDAAAIRSLIPHADRMCLLDEVLEWDADHVVCSAVSHRDPEHPLAVDGRLAALHLIEYGAQAMAVHGGLLARAVGQSAPPGMLVSVRNACFTVERLDDVPAPLIVRAVRRIAGATGWLYDFEAEGGGHRLGHGRVSVIPTRAPT